MPDLIIQPTKKWIRMQYWTIFIVFCVCVGLYVNMFADKVPAWILVVPALLFLLPVRTQLRRHFTRMTLSAGKLRYEAGILSKTTRTIPVANIQDVRADQTFGQRLMHLGDVTIETAGEAGSLSLRNVDEPQAVVEAIVDAQGPAARQKGGSV